MEIGIPPWDRRLIEILKPFQIFRRSFCLKPAMLLILISPINFTHFYTTLQKKSTLFLGEWIDLDRIKSRFIWYLTSVNKLETRETWLTESMNHWIIFEFNQWADDILQGCRYFDKFMLLVFFSQKNRIYRK